MGIETQAMPPQLDTITLAEGMDRTNYWKEAVKKLYSDDLNQVPHGFFIPIEDIHELSRLAGYYTEYIITGVRAYFTFHHPQPGIPPYTDSISAVMVPVYRDITVDKNTNTQISINRDLILPVPSLQPGVPGGETGHVTIYDVTTPCPPMCDPSSPLY